jgi:PEP-CTERM motif
MKIAVGTKELRRKSMKRISVVFCMMMMALSAFGVSFTQCPAVGLDTNGCELLITVLAVNGSGAATSFTVATASPDQGPFDGVEDTLLGITNSAAGTLTSIFLTGGAGSGIFGFDGDGACPAGNYTPGPTAAQCGTANPTGYGSAGASFSGISASRDSGTVNVNLTNGQSTWFDLEGRVTASSISGVPEPGSIVLLGTCMGACALFVRRRRKSA